MTQLSDWIGRQQTATDEITAAPAAALAATLDRPPERPAVGAPLPPLWHWLYFLPLARRSGIGPDGHPERGGFLPPVPQPRRMWAGSQLRFRLPLRVGDRVERRSTIADISEKSGRSGTLVFVRVEHEYYRRGQHDDHGDAALTEFHDIVYRDAPRPGEAAREPAAAPERARWRRRVDPDPVLLFRYSALTFNGHRIHYDRPYATEVEGYPGLVVHGPLLATLLLDALRDELDDPALNDFQFRALRPCFDTEPLLVCGAPDDDDGRTVRLWIQDERGRLNMDARATLA